MLVSVIIPVFNEERYIKELLLSVNKVKNIQKEIIVINDNSYDNTKEILEKECEHLYTKLINNKKNMGKGYYCRSGIEFSKGEIIIIQDADLEYNPENYKQLIDPIKFNEAQVVYGSRVLPGGRRTRPKTFDFKVRYLANLFLTFLSNILNGQKLTDCHTCYKVLKSEVIKNYFI